MHPEVVQDGPGPCPKCGMALEPKEVKLPAGKTRYTCPMHPEVVEDAPGACPKCGMALEPMSVTEDEEEDPELRNMTRRLWISLALTVPVLFLAMGGHVGIPLGPMDRGAPGALARTGTGNTHRVVGRVAVLRSRVEIGRNVEPEHVHADRAWHRRGLGL